MSTTPKKTPVALTQEAAPTVLSVRFHIAVHFNGMVTGSVSRDKHEATIAMSEAGVFVKAADKRPEHSGEFIHKFIPYANISEITLA